MNYKSPEERIEQLENEVATLRRMVMLLADFVRQDRNTHLLMYAKLIDQDNKLASVDLLTLKSVFEHSRGFDEPFRQAMLKVIADKQKENSSLQSSIEELKTLFSPILPEDLFGPNPKWPPKNPADPS